MNKFLYVGRLVNCKGIEDLIHAMSLTRQNGRQIDLNIVGMGPDYYVAHLKKLVQLKKLGDRVKFHGWIPSSEVRQWMGRAGCLVVPSRLEAYGMVALEGMAIGTPLIVSRTGGLNELVAHGCALTYEAGNVKQLSSVLMTALVNPSLLKSLAAKGGERALMFEWGQLAPSYLTILERVKRR
jgi:glycogen(starch) synthase